MKNKDWNIPYTRPCVSRDLAEAGFSPLLCQVLALRGVDSAEKARRLLYGGKDDVVPCTANAELFAKRFKDLGGKIIVEKRATYGHHPHGLAVGEQQRFVDFFNGK